MLHFLFPFIKFFIAMKKNIGELDGFIRLFSALGLVVVVLLFMKHLPFAIIFAMYVISIILMMTAVIGICPLYSLLGITTCPNEEKEA